MSRTKRKFDRAYKLKAVELSYERSNIRQLAEELGIRVELIYRWRREFRDRKEASFPGKGKLAQTDSEKELALLRRQVKELRLERDILKKAVSIPAYRPAGSPRATGNLQIYRTSSIRISCWEDV